MEKLKVDYTCDLNSIIKLSNLKSSIPFTCNKIMQSIFIINYNI